MVRLAENKDFDFVKKSWTVCFDDSPEFIDWNFEFNYSPKNTVIAEDDGIPASVMQLVPYKMNLGGVSFDVRYISGVATLPEYRGRGLVRRLFDFGIPHMKSLGCDISILVPAVDGMYEKFGYRKICRGMLCDANTANGFAAYNTIDEKLISTVQTLYRKEMTHKSVYIERSTDNFRKILTDLLCLSHGSVLINERDGIPVGYAFAYPKDGIYKVCEICGDISLNTKPAAASPVMARIINPESVAAKLSLELPDLDAGALTEWVFDRFDTQSKGYINLLL